MFEAACAYLQKPFRPLAKSDAGMSSIETGLWPFATQTFRRRPGIETHPTTESPPDTQRRPTRTGTTHRIPARCEGSLRRPRDVFALLPASIHTTSCTYEKEVDTHLTELSPLPQGYQPIQRWRLAKISRKGIADERRGRHRPATSHRRAQSPYPTTPPAFQRRGIPIPSPGSPDRTVSRDIRRRRHDCRLASLTRDSRFGARAVAPTTGGKPDAGCELTTRGN